MKKIILSFVALSFSFGVYSQTIVEAAVSNKDFSTLVTALKAADLVDALSGEGHLLYLLQIMQHFQKLILKL